MTPDYFRVQDRCYIRVSGSDAERYLNGQLSNDIRKLKPGNAMRACLLTAKGKLVADPYVWRERDAFIVEACAELAETLFARLDRYLVADDVLLEPLSLSELSPIYHCPGTQIPGALILNRLGVPGSDVSEPPADAVELTKNETERVRIQHAMPIWGRELDENVLPAEAGLDSLAVDFHKGCYVGQEVVSRIESVGKVRRKLVILQSQPLFSPGTELCLPGLPACIGHITSSVNVADSSQSLALAWIQSRYAETGTTLKPVSNPSDDLTEIKVIEKLP